MYCRKALTFNSKHYLPNGKGLHYFWHKISMLVFVYRSVRSLQPIRSKFFPKLGSERVVLRFPAAIFV